MRDVDAGELRSELFLGDRADRLAGVGEAHQQIERERDCDDHAEANDARHREERGPDLDHVEAIREVDGAGVGAERVEQRVLDHDREAQRDQQDVAVLAMPSTRLPKPGLSR